MKSFFEKDYQNKNYKNIWWAHIKRYFFYYFIGAFSIVCLNAADILIPKVMQIHIDKLTEKSVFDKTLFLYLLGLYLFQLVGRVVWRLTLARQTHLVSAEMRKKLWSKIKFLPIKRLNTDLNTGELMNVATGDINAARFIFGFTLVGTVDMLFLLIFSLIAMFSIDVELSFYALIVMPVLPVMLTKLANRSFDYQKESQEKLTNLTELASQSVASVRQHRLSNSEPFWIRRLNKISGGYKNQRWKLVKNDLSYFPITGLTPIISYIVLMVLGVQKVLDGSLSIGEFIALQSYTYIIQDPLVEMGWVISDWQRALSSLKRYVQILKEDPEAFLLPRKNTSQANDDSYAFEISNMSYSFDDGDALFKNFSIEVKKGEKFGIKGPVGSGKSIFLKLIAGHQYGFDGEIKVLGKNIKKWNHSDLTQDIAWVPQKSFLFADSVRNNLCLDREFSDADIFKALEIAGLEEDFRSFPDGLDTTLGEWGVNLSGGQKQRLTIARALLRKPKILLLDDCLSAVDTVTEDAILLRLINEYKDTTIVWVAHRDSTLKYCDRVVEFD